MAKNSETYKRIVAETYRDEASGSVRLRPVPGQSVAPQLRIKGCSACGRYPVGTRFRVKVKLTDVRGAKDYLYTSWQWPLEIIEQARN
jgi:hypothetical protein